jgi:hypothetical protein
VIYTDAQGRPVPKPDPADFPDTVSFIRAYHAWRDRIADVGNKAFEQQFRKSLRGTK